jgi:hypothetical protein
VEQPFPEPRRDTGGYPGATVAAAALATLFFPLLSLIAALFLYGAESNPVRRNALRSWALASGAWIVVQLIVAVALFAAVWAGSTSEVDRSGPCIGGPEIGSVGTPRDDGTTVFPCSISGTATVTVP